MKVIGSKISQKILSQFVTKDVLTIFLFCLINQSISNFFVCLNVAINKEEKCMIFSIEREVNGSIISFLDVKIFPENKKFVSSVF